MACRLAGANASHYPNNAGILLIEPLGINFNDILIEIYNALVVWQMVAILSRPQCVNTLRPRQNGRHFPDNIFKCIFLKENVSLSIKISQGPN